MLFPHKNVIRAQTFAHKNAIIGDIFAHKNAKTSIIFQIISKILVQAKKQSLSLQQNTKTYPDMKRLIIDDLRAWKNDSKHKPLILLGARQVGKTYILAQRSPLEYETLY